MKKILLFCTLLGGIFLTTSVSWAIMAPEYDVFDTREQIEASGQLGVCSVVSDGCSERNVVDGVIGDPIKMCKVTADFKFKWSCIAGDPNIMYMTGSPTVGGDSDEHGCKGSAGYSWDALAEKCTRAWEENTSFLSKNDLSQYETFKRKLSDATTTKLNVILKTYEKKLEKYPAWVSKNINKRAIKKLEAKISEFLSHFPSDKALSEKDNAKYILWTVSKYKLEIIGNKIP